MRKISSTEESKMEYEQLDIKSIVVKYIKFWYWFLIGIVICMTGAFFYLRYNTVPQYLSYATILIKEESPSQVINAGVAGGMGTSTLNKNLGNEIVLLKSKSLMYRVLSELSVGVSYAVEGNIREVELYYDNSPISIIVDEINLSAYEKKLIIKNLNNNEFTITEDDGTDQQTTSTHKFGQKINKSFGTFTIIITSNNLFSSDIILRFLDINNLVNHYSNNLFIELENQETNVLKISILDPIPQRSLHILEKLIEVYKREAIDDKNQVDRSTISFLDERIKLLSLELSTVERNVETYKRSNQLTDVNSNAEMYLQRAGEYSKQLEEFELQIDILNSLDNYIQKEELMLVPSSLNIGDPTLNALISKFNEIQLEKQRMLRTVQPNSSLIINIDDQLVNLRANILENLKNIRQSLLLTKNSLVASSSHYQNRISRVPSIERELLEINRQQHIKESIYLYLLQKREETGIALASNNSNSRIIDAPSFEQHPINPKKSSIYFGSFLLGLFFPFAIIFIRDLFNNKINNMEDIGSKTNIPILGEVYQSNNNYVLQISDRNVSPIAESLRMIRANLTFTNIGSKKNVILLTSSVSGEGKTFLSLNLAASLAISGKSVIMLGFDLRKPKSNYDLNINGNKGISNYLISEENSVEDYIFPFEGIPNLFLMGSGSNPPNPAELIMRPKVKNLISELRAKYDYVILDSPPVGLVSDALGLVSYVDSTIFVIRYNYTLKSQMNKICQLAESKQIKNPLLILNGAKKKNLKAYEYGYYSDDTQKARKKKQLMPTFP